MCELFLILYYQEHMLNLWGQITLLWSLGDLSFLLIRNPEDVVRHKVDEIVRDVTKGLRDVAVILSHRKFQMDISLHREGSLHYIWTNKKEWAFPSMHILIKIIEKE